MGATVDDRIVSMAFDSAKFQTGVSGTLSSIDKLNASLKGVGKDTNFDQIDKSANKVTFFGLTNAIDKIKAKFGRGVPEATDAFSDIEKASGKVGLLGIGSAIDKVKAKFGFEEADRAFSQIERSSGKVTLSGLGKAIDGIGVKFSGLQVAAVATFGTIVSKATLAGGNLLKSLTFEPLSGGMKEYETRLGSIQTILSNTKAAGTTLKDVNKTLAELNRYSDLTIYNFGQMAKNIGTFTAAGVDLKTATASIKGIANLAALSGSNADQAATAMYQLSQAISSGRVSLQDWNSVVNAGMGGSVFQRALAETAVAMGAIDESALKLKGKMKNVTIEGKSFRESIMAKPGEQSWLTKEVLTGTLKQFTGDMNEAELAAQGFSKAQIKAIQEQAKMAVDAATKVKSMSQLIDTAKETAESGWSDTWQIIFGDFNEAKTLFTGMSNALNGFISHTSEMRNSVLEDWKKLGGRKILIESLKNAFKALGDIIEPIKKAFRDVFPAKTGKDLLEITKSFRDFVDMLKPSPETVENLRRVFRGFFSILDIGKQILGGIWHGLKQVFGAMGEGSGNALDFAGTVGDLITKLKDWLREGDKIKVFFENLGTILAAPVRLIGSLTSALGGLFGSGDAGGATDSLSGMADALGPAEKAANAAEKAWSGFLRVLEKVGEFLEPIVAAIGKTFGELGDVIADTIASANFDNVFAAIQTVLIGGIFLAIKKAIGGGLNIDLGGGVLSNLTGSLDTLNGSLKAIQTNIKSNTLMQIAAAVALLAAAVVALSLIKPDRLSAAMTAVTVGLGQLMGAMAVMTKFGGMGLLQAAGFSGMAAGLVILAGALNVLALAMLILSQLSWEELAKGLAGIAGMLTILVIASRPLSQASPMLIAAGIGITALSIGLNILALAMKIFATMSWEDMGKGLAGVTAALIGIGLAMRLMPPTLPITAAGLILVGIGLTAVAASVLAFGKMKFETLAKGVGGIAAALVVLALAMNLMPPTLPLTAAGLILVGIGLASIAGSVALMGRMKIGTLAKGIIAIGAALLILGIGLTAMVATLPGAAALAVAAAALTILVPIIGIMGKMSWGTIVSGLAKMIASIIALGVAGAIATPGLLSLGVALTVLGLGMTAVAASVYLLVSGLTKLAGEGAKGIGITIAAFTAFVAILPKIIIDFIKGLVEIIAQIAKIAPEVTNSVYKIIQQMLKVIIKASPDFAKAAIALIGALLKVIRAKVPDYIRTGWVVLRALLDGIENNITKVTKSAIDIVLKFLKALTGKIPDIVEQGAETLVAFLKGISNHIRKVVGAAGDVVAAFLRGVGDNLKKIIEAGADIIIKVLKGVGNKIDDVVTAGGRIVAQFIKGIGNASVKIVNAGTNAAEKFLKAVVKGALKMVDAGFEAIIKFMNGVAKAIENRMPEMMEAGANIGKAIVKGMIKGLKDLAPDLLDSAKDIAKEAAQKMDPTGLLGSATIKLTKAQKEVLRSAGRELGTSFRDGMLGIVRETSQVDAAFVDMENKMVDRIKATQERINRLEERSDKAKKGTQKYKEIRKALTQENELLDRLNLANDTMIKHLGKQRGELSGLVGAYNKLTDQIDAAKAALQAAVDTRNQAYKGFSDQYSTTPDIIKEDAEGNPIDQLAAYNAALEAQVEATRKYKETLQALRAAGLDDATYQKLLDEGVGGQTFAQQLLDGGQTAIAAINELDRQLMVEATSLASNAAINLYQAGVNAAQGLVKSLEDSKSAIWVKMQQIAALMIKAIKNKLKIKSPSEVFADLGKQSMRGLARGFSRSSKLVTDAVAGVSTDALSAMKKSMKTVSDLVTDYIDPNPTITPVLDLSNVQNGSDLLKSMMAADPITAAASYGQAANISAEQESVRRAQEAMAGQAPIQFVQNNTSPESLSEIEVYRQTRNLLAQARPVLATT